MRLIDADPGWITSGAPRKGMGIIFNCPHCNSNICVWFSNPLDGGPPAPPEILPSPRWHRTGDNFENLTLIPSINTENHWHGFITNGEIINC